MKFIFAFSLCCILCTSSFGSAHLAFRASKEVVKLASQPVRHPVKDAHVVLSVAKFVL